MIHFSQITDNIFIGNVYSVIGDYRTRESDVLDILNIDLVISALTEDEYDHYMLEKKDVEDKEWHRFVIEDDEDEPISKIFATTYKIINDAVNQNKKIFVHCAAGMSRSTTIVIAYLILKNRWSYSEAYKFVKDKRSCTSPNAGFVKQLKELDRTF
jgi:protein-tyrosine phosphatase